MNDNKKTVLRTPGKTGSESTTTPDGQHIPVLLDQAIDALRIRADGLYVDATFGRGGHSTAILAALGEQGRVIAFDRDPEAVAYAQQINDSRLQVLHRRFSTIEQGLDEQGVDTVDGVLIDLGVSSPQLDQAGRGFSFQQDGPLDMRMDPSDGNPVSKWLNEAAEQDIAEVIKTYGEERFARPIAKAIVARRQDDTRPALRTTKQLADLVAGVVRRRGGRSKVAKNPATRTFQALRIFINQELEELTLVLNKAVDCLAPGGRLVVISFHSLEDRIVKEFMATESGQRAKKDPISGAPVHERTPRLGRVQRILAGVAEADQNVRARSAVMRVAERTDEAGVAA